MRPQRMPFAASEEGARFTGFSHREPLYLLTGRDAPVRGAPHHEGRKLSNRAADRVGEVGALPGDTAVLFRGAAEMAVGGGPAIDRPVELEGAADVGRPQREKLRQHLLELALLDL